MVMLLKGAKIFSPDPLGVTSILVGGGRILSIGEIDEAQLINSKVPVEVVSLKNRILTPGFIDGHNHLAGGSGETGGFHTATPQVALSELISAGVTTVVGLLGTDVITKTLSALLARVKALRAEGLTAYMYTGGYRIPPATLTGDVQKDILYIDEIIGVGEVAISDDRSSEPIREEIARLVTDAHVAGMLSSKAGIMHLHLGSCDHGLKPIIDVLDTYSSIQPQWFYPTHVNRTSETIKQAARLSQRGMFVDFDTVDEDLAEWIPRFLDHGGKFEKLTVTSDCATTATSNLYKEIRRCVVDHDYELERILRLITSHPAEVLKLHGRGRIKVGNSADFVALDEKSLEIRDVMARGKWMIRDQVEVVRETFLEDSNRTIHLVGKKSKEGKNAYS